MKKFEINIEEKLLRTIKIDAENEREAIERANKMYENEEVVLTSDHYINTEINTTENFNNKAEKNSLISEVIDYLYYDEKKHFKESGKHKSSNHIFLKLEKLRTMI